MTEQFLEFLQTEHAGMFTELIVSMKYDTLKIHSFLSKHHHRELLPFLSEMMLLLELRKKATGKFSEASNMLFTRRGLEQSTGENIAKYKASQTLSGGNILVLCGGIGGEALALAKHAKEVTVVDADPLMTFIGTYNASVYGLSEHMRFVTEKAEHFLTTLGERRFDAIYIDPDRRDEQTRHISIADYHPNILEIMYELLTHSPHVFCKISPRIRREELEKLPHLISYEFIQEDQDLKECFLHFMKEPTKTISIATKITEGEIVQISSGENASFKKCIHSSLEMQQFLYEPDAALLRATLVEKCAENISGMFLSEKGALLTTKEINDFGKTWGTYFEVVEVLPFHAATIKEYLKKKNIRHIIIKKRYFPLEPHEMRKMLKIQEGGEDILYCTTLADTKVVIHCKREER